jgi:CheY-like chemotaxis protein
MQGGDRFDPSGLTALVLDDNHYERGISLDQLRAMGFKRAIGAANTMEAWEALKLSNPNVVLMEWFDGTGGDGLDFARRVRKNEETPNRAVPMFMLTTRGSERDVELARLAGVDGYLRKPVSRQPAAVCRNGQLCRPLPAPASAGFELPGPAAAPG